MRAVGMAVVVLGLAACGTEPAKPPAHAAVIPDAPTPSDSPKAKADSDSERVRRAVTEEEERLRFERLRLRGVEIVGTIAFGGPSRSVTDCLPPLTPEDVRRLAEGKPVNLPAPRFVPTAEGVDLLAPRLGTVREVRDEEVVIDVAARASTAPGRQFLVARGARAVATGEITHVEGTTVRGRIHRTFREGPPQVGDVVFLR